ncbi:MAG: phosphonoacetaldehyde hydrolase [Deltaproteobacteria bacterium]|nr:phosphonoacetaldehyde hydrolase [Deltaproteobacteria bacterium]
MNKSNVFRPYTGQIQAVILDWAGTTVDHGCIGPVAVFVEVFARLGVEVTITEARAPMGLMKKDHIRAMCQDPAVREKWSRVHGRPPEEIDVEDLYGLTERLMLETIAHHAQPISGLLETVAVLRSQGLKIGSTTGYTRPMMEVLLPVAAHYGYAPDAVVCSTDVVRGRPYPYMCYKNCVELGVCPLEAVVKIGGTVADIEEGLNAGMWTIGITRTGNELGLTAAETAARPVTEIKARTQAIGEKLLRAGAHYVVEDIAAILPIIEIINQRLADGRQP